MDSPLPGGPVHGGDVESAARASGQDPDAILDFSANIHPWGPPPGALEAARAAIDRAHRYPSPRGEPMRRLLSERTGQAVLLGNGATELLALALRGCRRLAVRAPSYMGYPEAAWPCEVVHDLDDPRADAVVVGRPNNPDGHLPSVEEVLALRRPGRRVVVDESFLAFTGAPSCQGQEGLVVITSMTKTFGIPGLRLGYATGLDERGLPPWSVNGPALAAGRVCLEHWDWPRRPPLDAWREALRAALLRLPRVEAVQGAANFLLLRLRRPEAGLLRGRALADHGVLLRDASNFAGLDAHYLRVAVRRPEENARLIEALA